MKKEKRTITILIVFAYLFLLLGIALIVVCALGLFSEEMAAPIAAGGLLSFVPFVICGNIAHFKAKERRSEKGFKLLYVLTFPPFGILCILGIFVIIGKLILNFVKSWAGYDTPTSSKSSYNSHPDCSVRDAHGNKRELTYYDHGHTNGGTSETYREYYRYKDDLGYFWRTYDNGKTFVQERPGQNAYDL